MVGGAAEKGGAEMKLEINYYATIDDHSRGILTRCTIDCFDLEEALTIVAKFKWRVVSWDLYKNKVLK